ncbi:MAG: KOW domain-containing RNA-binding protein [Oscillospiraceae bacterium]
MEPQQGQIVFSTAGHDKGHPFLVMQRTGDFLLLVDGKERKVASPKRKRCKHTVYGGECRDQAIGTRLGVQPVLDSEIRRALAVFREETGGYGAWQKTT